MNWVEYKLEDDSVIKVPYNRCNVATVTKKVLEQLINTFNESIHQAKILEHIKTNYAERLLEQYEKGRADAIAELLKELCIGCAYLNGTKCEIKGGCPCSIGQSEIIRSASKVLEQLKEQKMDRVKENEIYDKFQDLCNLYKDIILSDDKHMCNTECPLRDTNRCENVFFYQQGRADEQIQSIEDAKKQAAEYLDALDKAKKEAYQQGAREFAEWSIQNNIDFSHCEDSDCDNCTRTICRNAQTYTDVVLAEWQKGEE